MMERTQLPLRYNFSYRNDTKMITAEMLSGLQDFKCWFNKLTATR